MAQTFAVVNQKGGVGKTTTAVNLSACLAIAGSRVLLIDLDPQGNATSGAGADRAGIQYSTYDVLVDGVDPRQAVTPTAVEGLMLLAANVDLAGAELELVSAIARENRLRDALSGLQDAFDFIVIDGPPSLGLLTLNALAAADGLIIPIQAEYYALEGISQLMRTIDLVRRQINRDLYVARVVLTMLDTRTRLAQQVVLEVQKFFGETVSPVVIPRNVRLSEAPSHGLPIALYDPRSRGAVAYAKIAQEILNGKTGTR